MITFPARAKAANGTVYMFCRYQLFSPMFPEAGKLFTFTIYLLCTMTGGKLPENEIEIIS